MDDVWGIVLAAGASTRMKTQKMLLPFAGKTVIETVVDRIFGALKKNIMVVLGSHQDEIVPLIENLQVPYCINENYMHGMHTSVICGFCSLPARAKAALIVLGDQPQIKNQTIDLLTKEWQRCGKGIVIPAVNGRRGHPVLIETRFREAICSIGPGEGLRGFINSHQDDICEVECGNPDILRDMDTPEDYLREINKTN
jgi:molybdenum cofactor cytidylyltransferase